MPYRPLFIRALQALRTESPANAVRWLGSLLHFVTDTGSPPHALVYKGDIQANDRARCEPIALESAGRDRPRRRPILCTRCWFCRRALCPAANFARK